MLIVRTTKQFRKDAKKASKQGQNLSILERVMDDIAEEKPLDPKHRNHVLVGSYAGKCECHLIPDWLLIYEITDTEVIFVRTGSHSELFKK